MTLYNRIFIFLLAVISYTAATAQTVATYDTLKARKGLVLVGKTLTSVTETITSGSTHRQIPTAKSVWDLFLTAGGGTVTTNATLDGDGSIGDPLTIAQQSATSGQVLKWNGSTWLPGTDNSFTISDLTDSETLNGATLFVIGTGRSTADYDPGGNSLTINTPPYTAGTGIDVTGSVISNTGDTNAGDDITTATTAGGDLNGSFPNPTVDGLQGRTVASTAPSSGQVLKWDGSTWAPANDNVGSVTTNDLVGTARTAITNGVGAILGASEVTVDVTESGLNPANIPITDTGNYFPTDNINAALQSLGANSHVPVTVADNARLDFTLTGQQVTADLAQNGATSGQVMKWNGSAWAPGTDNNDTYTAGTGISIASNVITNTGDLSSTNEIQNLSLTGQSLGISGGGTGVTLPVVNVVAGTAISVSSAAGAFTINNTGDTNGTDDITSGSTAGGDLNGTFPNPTVDGLQGRPVASTAPSSNQVLKWNGSSWAPAADADTDAQTLYEDDRDGNNLFLGILGGNIYTVPAATTTLAGLMTGADKSKVHDPVSVTDDAMINFTLTTQNLTGNLIDNSITGAKIAQAGATSGQALKWNGSTWAPADDATGGGGLSEPAGQAVVGTGSGADSYAEFKYLTGSNDLQLLNTSGANNANVSARTDDTTGVFNAALRSDLNTAYSALAVNTASNGHTYFRAKPVGFTGLSNFGSFNINGGYFAGVNAPYSTRPNYVWNIGYNYNPGAGREISTEPAFGIGFETYYQAAALASGSTGFGEFHVRFTDTTNVERRFMTAVLPWDGARGKSDLGFLTDNLYYHDYANSPVWNHNPLANLWEFSDTTVFRFSERRGFALNVLNGAGSTYMEIMKFDNEDTLSIGGNNLPGIKMQRDVVFNTSRLFAQSGVNQFDIGSTSRRTNLYVTGLGIFDKRVRAYNTYSSTSGAGSNDYDNFILQNTDGTNNNWSAISSYSSTGNIGSSIGFRHVDHSIGQDDIYFYTRNSSSAYGERFRIGGSNVTSTMPFVASSTFTSTGPATFSDISTFNGIPTFNASPVFNTTVNVGSASLGSRLNVVNDYSSTAVAGSNAFTALQLSNRNTTNNNWTALEFGAGGAFGTISSDIAAQFTDHSLLYSDIVFHLRTNSGYNEVMRIKGGNPGRRVGIMNNNPQEVLDVTGNIRASGQAGTGNRLLQADANGTQVRSTIDPATVPTASGTTNTIAKFTGASTLGNSRITDDGNDITVNNAVANTVIENSSAAGYIVLQTAFQSLTIDNLTDKTFFVDNSATPEGMQYDQDYSATFALHSMISKKYADEHLASRPASTTAPTTGQVMKWNGSAWAPAADDTGGGGSATDLTFTGTSSPVTLNSSTGTDVTITAGTGASLSATGTNITITNTAPAPTGTSGQTVRYDGSNALVATSALTNDGTTVAAADMNLSGKVALSGDISPSDLSADVNDYNPASLSSTGVIYISSDAGFWHIKGLQGGSDGRMITFINDGSYPFAFAPEHAGSTAANRFAGSTDIICYPNKSVTWIYDATASRWRLKEYAGEFDFSYGNFVGRNWSAASITAGDWGNLTFYSSGTGAGSTAGAPSSVLPYSSVTLSAGTTTTGYAGVAYSKTSLPFWGSSMYRKSRYQVLIPTLSTGTERFIVYARESQAISQGAIGNNQWGFIYSDDVNGGEWQAFTRNNAGAESTLDCNVAVTANAIYNLETVVNKNGTECRFFINGAYVGAITGNMPTWTAGYCPQATITKTVGTTARTMSWLTGSNLFMY